MIPDVVIMGARYKTALSSSKVYEDLNLLFLKYNEQGEAVPSEGITIGYQLLPWLSRFLGVDINNLINIIFYSSALIFFSLGAYSILRLNFNMRLKAVSLIFLTFSYYFVISETFFIVASYSFYFFWGSAILIIVSLNFKHISQSKLILVALILSFLMILTGLFRDFSYWIFITFFITYLIFEIHWSKKIRLVCIIILLLPFVANKIVHSKTNEVQIKNYYSIYKKDFDTKIIQGASWEMTVLAGLAFLQNQYISEFRDQAIADFLRERNENYTLMITEENHKILRDELVSILKKDRNFIFRVITAKIGVLLAWLVIFANVGLFYLFSSKIQKKLKYSFMLAVPTSFLVPLMALPVTFYNTGLVGLSTCLCICGILNFNFSIFKEQLKKIF